MSKTITQLFALTTCLATCGLCNLADAQAPATGVEPAPGVGPAQLAAQSCVLLNNDNVLFGHAQQVGEFVVVHTGQGSEVKLSRKEVACWAASLRDLYRYRVDRRQKGDISAHLRDARWCLRYDLFDLAKDEIDAIKKLHPKNTDVELIERRLQRITSPSSSETTAVVSRPPPAKQADFEKPYTELSGVDLATLRGFASHIQPTLINRCGRCHSETSSRGWTLTLPTVGARPSSRMTRENLNKALAFVNPSEPELSELFVKATSPHGGAPASLDARNARPIRSFTSWLNMISSLLPAPDDGVHKVDHQDPIGTPLSTDDTASENVAGENFRGNEVPTNSSGQPARLPQVANPFDPDLFNRRFHGDSGE